MLKDFLEFLAQFKQAPAVAFTSLLIGGSIGYTIADTLSNAKVKNSESAVKNSESAVKSAEALATYKAEDATRQEKAANSAVQELNKCKEQSATRSVCPPLDASVYTTKISALQADVAARDKTISANTAEREKAIEAERTKLAAANQDRLAKCTEAVSKLALVPADLATCSASLQDSKRTCEAKVATLKKNADATSSSFKACQADLKLLQTPNSDPREFKADGTRYSYRSLEFLQLKKAMNYTLLNGGVSLILEAAHDDGTATIITNVSPDNKPMKIKAGSQIPFSFQGKGYVFDVRSVSDNYVSMDFGERGPPPVQPLR